VTRKVTRIARNIHIMGRRDRSLRPTGMLTRDGIFTGGIFNDEASQGTVLAAATRTASSPAYGPLPGFYARGTPKCRTDEFRFGASS
jgi:hypothetical protein